MAIIDAVVRLIPNVLGDEQSTEIDSFSQQHGLLENAQYTRPREFRGHKVPEILLSGDHAAIAAWREEQSYQRTAERREDLLAKRVATEKKYDKPTDKTAKQKDQDQ
jgi:tRNA (guanine37-N1)-methyltransferase